jgi:hypothetical protein
MCGRFEVMGPGVYNPRVAARRKKAGSPDAPRETPPEIEKALSALRDEIAELRRALTTTAPVAAGSPSELAGVVQKLKESAELLASGLKDVPKVDDFQPLADHLYEFAQAMPQLAKSLQGVQQAVEPLEDAVRALEHVLVTLPRAEDYEPLIGPLREFAKVAPALAEQLAVVMKSVAPLHDTVAQLRKTAESLRQAPPGPAGDGAAERMAQARQAIRDALASLPRDPEYRRVADHLKALASVSPSLGEWLAEVPKLSMPLGDSIASLQHAAALLSDGEDALRSPSTTTTRAAGPRRSRR